MNPEAQDQGARFEAVFAGIATTRMAGVPVLNPALGVAMRGWQAVEPFELGVLVTPWFMNLLAVPQAGGPTAARVGEKAHLALPSGAYEAIWSHEAALGGFGRSRCFRRWTNLKAWRPRWPPPMPRWPKSCRARAGAAARACAARGGARACQPPGLFRLGGAEKAA
jgi:hypothetical protein